MPSRAPCPPGCDCRKHAPARAKRQPTWPEWKLQPCGTPAAARRHWRRGEPLDEECLQAARRDRGAYTGALTPDHREIRNGLPEFVPYVYRGLGYDIYEEAS